MKINFNSRVNFTSSSRIHECIATPRNNRGSRFPAGWRVAGFALGLGLLTLPAGLVHAQSEGVPSRAELRALQAEVDALRAEVEELRRDTDVAGVEVERAAEPLRDFERFAPREPIEQITIWDSILTFTAPEDRFSLTIRGRIQPRYEYERRDDPPAGAADSHSSFSIRRVRLDLRGHAYTRDLTYRVMPEWSRSPAGLRDAWADYRFNDAAALRFGQYQVPFAWERDSSSNRHQFVERSTANDEFQWNDGRDLGLMLHGNLTGDVRYGIGVFGGEGREVRRTNSDGHLYTARLTYSPIGKYPDSEALVEPVEDTHLSFGLGAGYANKNTPRPRPATTPAWTNAHVFTGTADAHFQVDRFSTHLIGFYRDVDPRSAGERSFDGLGYTVQTGCLLVRNRLFGSLRYSQSEPDRNRDFGKQREYMSGLQFYQFGHSAKLHLEAGRVRLHDGNAWMDTDVIRAQYQLLF